MARGIAWAALLLGLWASLAWAGDDAALRGSWRPASAGEGIGSLTGAGAGWQRFDPARSTSHGAAPHGNWVLLWAGDAGWPPAPWVLEVGRPGRQAVTLFPPGGGAPQRASLGPDARVPPADMHGGREWPAHGRIGFVIEQAPAPGAPLRLHVDASQVTPAPVHYRLRSLPDYLAADAHWLAFATACLAVMVTMAAMALLFGVWLREPTFIAYVIYVLAYALILAGQSGYVLDPLGWEWVAANVDRWARPATALTVVFAVVFLDRFADLRRYLPRGRLLPWAVAAATALLSLVGALPGLAGVARALINPLLILGGPVLLFAALVAAWRGSRYGAFFLVGWAPLLTVTVLGSLQLYGHFDGWTWLGNAAMAAGAFEAVVLTIGLAERNAGLRRERDRARMLADLDELTGLLNRRAWGERVLRLGEPQRQESLVLLFLDLDHFKQVNDRFGHATGDAALRVLADVMRHTVRHEELIGRYGGEEFVVALPGIDGAHALEVAERIRRRFRASAASLAEGLSVSIGVAHLRPGEEVARVLARADAALYSAKASGRDRVVLAD